MKGSFGGFGLFEMMDSILPRDDPSIDDSTELWRRLHPTWVKPSGGGLRITSAAFQNAKYHDAISVCVTCDAPEDYTPRLFAKHEGYGAAAIDAREARRNGQGIERVPEEGETAHGHIVGEKSKAVRKRLARAARLLIVPGTELE